MEDRPCCHGSGSILFSGVCGSLHHDRGRSSLYLTNHSPRNTSNSASDQSHRLFINWKESDQVKTDLQANV